MRLLAVLAVLALPLAGCLAPAEVAPSALRPAPVDLPRPDLLPLVFDAVVKLLPIGGTEPSVRVNPQDHIFVTTTGANLWRSLDGGATFEGVGEEVCRGPAASLPTCPPAFRDRDSGLRGGGDGSLVIDVEGRLHWAGLFGPNASVPYQYSDDEGATWTESFDLADGNSTDREWLAVAPNGTTVYALWRDSGAPSDSLIGFGSDFQAGLRFRASHDRGATWGPILAVEEENPVDGPLAVDPVSGALYFGASYFDGRPVTIFRSFDAGQSWDSIALPAATGSPVAGFGGITHFIFPVVAVDAAGTVYAAWAEDPEAAPELWTFGGKTAMRPKVFLSTSKDQGATWTEPALMSAGDRSAVMPAIVAGAPGRVALAWYEASTPLPSDVLPNEWFVRLAVSTTADQAEPVWEVASTTEEPIHLGSICTQGTGCTVGDRSRGDFFEVALRPNGLPIVAFVQDAVPTNEGQRRTDVVVVRVAEGTPLLDVPGQR